jgi:heparan-alpha-glucosaminide N-acetyltransferase
MNPTPQTTPNERLASVDAYRGLVMFLMMAEVLNFRSVSRALPDSEVWGFLAYLQYHVDWVGCTLHDLIQPSFSFLVGVALPFSLASRIAKGQSATQLTLHAFWRALILILLGVFLRSVGRPMLNWTFEDTLSQIGLGYGFLFMLGQRSVKVQWTALAVILVGYWAAFVMYPLPPADFPYAKVNVPKEWLDTYGLTGFAAHWQKNSNLAWAFDTWWMNLFPREKPFEFSGGGYATLSFIPTLGTMILGLIAGGILRSERTAWDKVKWFAAAGVIGLASGWLLNALGICPVVKRIWTPSWVLFSGGWCFLFLAGFYALMDIRQRRGWAFPLVVIGANSIAAYVMAHLFEGFIMKMLKTVFGQDAFKVFGAPYEPVFLGAATLLVLWLILLWMYRRKIFLKV